MNACCSGCSAPPEASPSIVVTSRPSYCTASARHDRIRSPSTSTVQAPHAPWLQPFFVPKSSKCSRTKSSNETRASVGTGASRPLMIIDTPEPPFNELLTEATLLPFIPTKLGAAETSAGSRPRSPIGGPAIASIPATCGRSSVGRASASQAEGRGFETRRPLSRPRRTSHKLAANGHFGVSVQSVRPQASAGNGSPRAWAMISSLR